tara:strand:+ start:9521 stop:10903 length:1383 start_codon:yes stop_codon:yes gene_type:complete
MATNRDLLKEAIADAKAVKEMAIANAKTALEEAFEPRLKEMLSEKIQKMDEEEVTETYYEEDDSTMEEEMKYEEDSMMTEVDLEELLAELELEEEEVEETLNEEEVEEAMYEEDDSEDDGDDMDTEEGEPLDLEDMTDEDLKKMIEDVIADMVASGELEGGDVEDEDEGEEMEMSDENEEEVDLAELLKEVESELEEAEMSEEMKDKKEMSEEMKDKDSMEEVELTEADLDEMYNQYGEETVNEILGKLKDAFKAGTSYVKKFMKGNSMEIEKLMKIEDKSARLKAAEPLIMKFRKMNAAEMDPSAMRSDVDVLRKAIGTSGLGGATKGAVSTAESLQTELNEALEANKVLSTELNEAVKETNATNLLNAKLLFTNKIFKSKNLNESQKVKVLSSFDKANTVKETKLVYETLNEGLKVKKSTIKENLGRASKTSIVPTTKKPIVESNDVFARMQKLAGLK